MISAKDVDVTEDFFQMRHQLNEKKGFRKKLLTLFDPPETSQVKKTNSMGLCLCILEIAFKPCWNFFEFFLNNMYNTIYNALYII